jgi:hypothetical protein
MATWYMYHRREVLPNESTEIPRVVVELHKRPYDVSAWALARRLCVLMGWRWCP